jgi:hypothetical protein
MGLAEPVPYRLGGTEWQVSGAGEKLPQAPARSSGKVSGKNLHDVIKSLRNSPVFYPNRDSWLFCSDEFTRISWLKSSVPPVFHAGDRGSNLLGDAPR